MDLASWGVFPSVGPLYPSGFDTERTIVEHDEVLKRHIICCWQHQSSPLVAADTPPQYPSHLPYPPQNSITASQFSSLSLQTTGGRERGICFVFVTLIMLVVIESWVIFISTLLRKKNCNRKLKRGFLIEHVQRVPPGFGLFFMF